MFIGPSVVEVMRTSFLSFSVIGIEWFITLKLTIGLPILQKHEYTYNMSERQRQREGKRERERERDRERQRDRQR